MQHRTCRHVMLPFLSEFNKHELPLNNLLISIKIFALVFSFLQIFFISMRTIQNKVQTLAAQVQDTPVIIGEVHAGQLNCPTS